MFGVLVNSSEIVLVNSRQRTCFPNPLVNYATYEKILRCEVGEEKLNIYRIETLVDLPQKHLSITILNMILLCYSEKNHTWLNQFSKFLCFEEFQPSCRYQSLSCLKFVLKKRLQRVLRQRSFRFSKKTLISV